jgi:hypothetical protein
MAGLFDGKVAFISGAARGQGRSHAVRFAEEGADIIAVDLCDQIACVAYPMTTREDLDETVNLVEKTGRRIVAEQGDVRDFEKLKAVVAEGVSQLGRLDFVLANAGILPAVGEERHDIAAYVDSVDVLLNGVYYTIEAALPALLDHDEGGAIVITSSTAGLNSLGPDVQQSEPRPGRLPRRQARRRRPNALLRNLIGGEEYSSQHGASDRRRHANDRQRAVRAIDGRTSRRCICVAGAAAGGARRSR